MFPQSINNAGVIGKMVWCVENVINDIADIFERVNMSAKTYLIRKYSKILIRGTNFGKIRKNHE